MRIETERLLIRSIKRGDEKDFADMAKDGSLLDVGFDSNCADWIGGWIEEAIQNDKHDNPEADYIAYTVCKKSNEAIIGAVGCSYYEDLKQIGITYFIGQEYRKKGYAFEAVQAYTKYFFTHYPIQKLIANIREENVASWKTIEKSSFRFVERKMYQDINDTEEKLYRFYEKSAYGNK